MTTIRIAGVIIEKDGKILFNKRKCAPGIGKLDLVGGFVNAEETPEHAAVREVQEETGYIVHVISKIYFGNYFEREEKEMHLFSAEIIGGTEISSEEGNPTWKAKEELSERDFAFSYIYPLLKRRVL